MQWFCNRQGRRARPPPVLPYSDWTWLLYDGKPADILRPVADDLVSRCGMPAFGSITVCERLVRR